MYHKEIKVSTDKQHGYQYFHDIIHPLANKYGKVWYHRHVMSIHLGRWIMVDEHVHHLDGNRSNNAIENLVLMSSAEHARWHKDMHPRRLRPIKWAYCGAEFQPESRRNKYCSKKCYIEARRKLRIPDMAIFKKRLWEIPSTIISKELGVSDSMLSRFCRENGIAKPGPGYWAKTKQ